MPWKKIQYNHLPQRQLKLGDASASFPLHPRKSCCLKNPASLKKKKAKLGAKSWVSRASHPSVGRLIPSGHSGGTDGTWESHVTITHPTEVSLPSPMENKCPEGGGCCYFSPQVNEAVLLGKESYITHGSVEFSRIPWHSHAGRVGTTKLTLASTGSRQTPWLWETTTIKRQYL